MSYPIPTSSSTHEHEAQSPLPVLADIATVVAATLGCDHIAVVMQACAIDVTTRGFSAAEHQMIETRTSDFVAFLEGADLAADPHADLRRLMSTPTFRPESAIALQIDGLVPGIVVAASVDETSFDPVQLAALRTVVSATVSASLGPATGLHEQVLNTLGESIVVTDAHDHVIWNNVAAEGMFACSPKGQHLSDLDLSTTHRQLDERIAPLIDPVRQRLSGTVRTYRDITDRVEQRDKLERLVNTDALTGVPNRRCFMTALRRALATNHPGTVHMLCLVDLDRFKSVNDVLGHKTGDEILVEVAKMLSEHIGDLGMVGRLGGDEFALLLENSDLRTAKSLVEDFLDQLYRRMRNYRDERSRVTASIGITTLRRDDTTPAAPLHRADVACYAAKRAGGSCVRARR